MGTAQPAGTVILFSGARHRQGHEGTTRACLAGRIAALKGYRYAGEYDAGADLAGPLYWVPADTLVGEEARQLGIVSAQDLFGGVVGPSFAATKTITHPLVNAGAVAPAGWTPRFAARLQGAVLPGFSVFSVADGRQAGARLLPRGSVRIKAGRGIGGRGQAVAADMDQLMATLTGLEPTELAAYGVVIEQNLADVVTYSIGQVQLGDLCASYHGVQHQTTNHEGEAAYGGSDLWVVRGDFDVLATMELAPPIRTALERARRYDDATAELPGFMASRRNYDVVAGHDRDGRLCTGVLEQSWRIGGASPAEIAALETFAANPDVHALRASCHEVYDLIAPPAQAVVHYRGTDDQVGALTKYSLVERHADPP